MSDLWNPLLYRDIFFTHWVPPTIGVLLIHYVVNRLLQKSDQRLSSVGDHLGLDLFASVPAYTRLLFRWQFLFCAAVQLIVLSVTIYSTRGVAIKVGYETQAKIYKQYLDKSFEPVTHPPEVRGLSTDFFIAMLTLVDIRGFVATDDDREVLLLVPADWDLDKTKAALSSETWARDGDTLVPKSILSHLRSAELTAASALRVLPVFFYRVIPILLCLLWALALPGAIVGYLVETRVLRYLERHATRRENSKPRPIGHIRPWVPTLHQLIGHYFNQWPLVVQTEAKKRLVLAPHDFQALQKGYFIDTLPKCPGMSAPVYLVFYLLSAVTLILAIPFAIYSALVFSKNVILVSSKNAERKSASPG